MSIRSIRTTARHRSPRASAPAVILFGALALSGCYGYTTVGAEFPAYADVGIGVPVSVATDVPYGIYAYPHYYYNGAYVYLADGRWYYPRYGHWYVLHGEPHALAHYRASLPYYGYHGGYRYGAPAGHPYATPYRPGTPYYSQPGGRYYSVPGQRGAVPGYAYPGGVYRSPAHHYGYPATPSYHGYPAPYGGRSYHRHP